MGDKQEEPVPQQQKKVEVVPTVVEKIVVTVNPLDDIAKQYAKFRNNNMDNQAAWAAITTINGWSEDDSKMKFIDLKMYLGKDAVTNAIILAQLAEKKTGYYKNHKKKLKRKYMKIENKFRFITFIVIIAILIGGINQAFFKKIILIP
jgi:hypothetical protein